MKIQENFYNYVSKRLNQLIDKQKSEDQNILFWCGIKFSKQKSFLATQAPCGCIHNIWRSVVISQSNNTKT
jgi:hypothetical protein